MVLAMALRRLAFGLLRLLLAVAVIVTASGGSLWWYFHPTVQRANGIVYGQRGSVPLPLDAIRPSAPNGRGVLVLVSGAWKSAKPGSLPTWFVAPLLRRGYTVFAVYHVSQPQATVMEIVEDIHRAVRFVRYHAADFGVSTRRLGVVGASSGGHLSLMLATQSGAGRLDPADPVDRQSSAVQAVAVFFPATDLLNLGASTENAGDGGPPKSFRQGAFGPRSTNLGHWKVLGRDLSPIYHVTTNLPPVLIHHGDADKIVPLDQSLRFQARAREVGRTVEIVIRRGKGHGWWTFPWDVRRFGCWLDRHL